MAADDALAHIAAAAGLLPVPAADDATRTMWAGQDGVEFGVVPRDGAWTVETRERGAHRELGRCTTRHDAERLLALRLTNTARAAAGRSAVHVDGFAPGADWSEGPDRSVLTWPGGRAEFPPGISGRNLGREFSWVALTPLTEIEERVDLPDLR